MNDTAIPTGQESAVRYAMDMCNVTQFATLPEFWVLRVYSQDGATIGFYWHPNEAVMDAKEEDMKRINTTWVCKRVKYIQGGAP
ncbi:MAG TPA: hypothetical protein VHO25_14540 [Polyangiaceae bacterium]|nr:hypothetical protein [Polyangiaceae bacterium]